MKKRIFDNTIVVSIIVLILSSTFSFFLYYGNHRKNAEKDLTSLISLIDSTINFEEDKIEYLKNISKSNENIRITYVSSGNEILFDSYDDILGIKRHIDSEEFEDSVKTGIYNPNRYSSGAFKDVYYNAFKLKDGSILRVSKEIESMFSLFFDMIPVNLLILLFIVISSKALSSRTSEKIVNSVKESLERNIVIEEEIPEISPVIFEIKSQRDIIERQLEEIKVERDTITIILENMEEGFLMIDTKKSILLINKAALNFLNATKSVLNKNILYLTRDEEIINSIEEALKGNSSEGIINSMDREIKFYSNPVYLKDTIAGSILFLIDETEQIRSQRIREEFSANVSHELKTPITSIYGFAELLKNDMIPAEEDRVEFLNSIYNESKRLLELTDDIMKISKLEEGSELLKSKVDLKKLSEEVLFSFTKFAEDKSVKLHLKGEASIIANENMMWEMISNLVENAIKYNRENGEVTVELNEDGKVKIKVSDTGIGIPRAKQNRIFERFYRVDESRNKKTGGTGLGLSIVKHIVKNHGGEIKFKSKEGIGTEIEIELPKVT
ncbi:sensor histidine kinase [Anaerosphaera multitolerans]|uniref:histidine kinase n=1 Tax=Anaerosphaera multitolerans TaxID=2487351 RepID=A0A437S503_9FIRM|nr:ATP-binding protein [Anaerosphaera multitolerans]RVU54057.1 GHKL domain-containing protein [Anaerosphaera multitolerans]